MNVNVCVCVLVCVCVVAETTVVKIQTLARLGFNKHALVLGVQRFGDCPWSTNAHEQGHGAAAVIHKSHPERSLQQVTSRGLLSIVRPVYSPAPVDSLFKRASAALEKVGEEEAQQSRCQADVLERSGGCDGR